MDTKFGIWSKLNDSDSRALAPIFKEWNKLILRYIKNEDYREAPYYFGERANLSILLAAAFRIGGYGLQEYAAAKRGTPKNRRGRPRREVPGRGDLFFATKGGREFYIEAKHKWDGGTPLSSNREHIKSLISRARDDAQATLGTGRRFGLAMFPISYLQTNGHGDNDLPYNQNNCDSIICKTIQYYRENDPKAMWAWSFPEQARMLREKEDGKYRYWPGIILAIKAAKHKRG